MSNDYDVRFRMDNMYEVIRKSDRKQMYVGTIEEVNAWLDMAQKGFEL